LHSIIGQLTTSPVTKKSDLAMPGVLSPQCQNQEKVTKSLNLNPGHFRGNNICQGQDDSLIKQLDKKENCSNPTVFDFSEVCLDSFKVKHNAESSKTASKPQTNPLVRRAENAQPRGQFVQNSHAHTLKVNIKGKIKPETVKASFQKYFAFESSYSAQKSIEFSLSKTPQNNTLNFSINLSSPKQKIEERAVTECYSSPPPACDVQKKLVFKSPENIISPKGYYLGNMTMTEKTNRNKENRLESTRESRIQFSYETSYTQPYLFSS